MAVRTAVFREHKFAEDTGPNVSAVYAMGSETEFTMRAEKGGHRCWQFHAAPVGHIIRPHQLEPEWLIQRVFNQGRGDRREMGMDEEDAFARLLGYPRHVVCRLIKVARDVAISHLFGSFDDPFKATSRVRYWRGDFAERYAMKKRAGRGPGMGSRKTKIS